MRNIALAVVLMIAAIFTASAQPIATRTSTLLWDNENPWIETVNFTFTGYTPANAVIGSATAVTNKMPIISIMGNSPNGTYYVNGIVLATSGLTSDPSTNLTFIWLGTIAIKTQPVGLTVRNGESASFTVVTHGGAGTVTYQWARNGSVIPGATGQTFLIANATPSNNGSYTVACTDTTGTVTSQAASLTVIPKPKSPVDIKLSP
jgi:hypothetical protein